MHAMWFNEDKVGGWRDWNGDNELRGIMQNAWWVALGMGTVSAGTPLF